MSKLFEENDADTDEEIKINDGYATNYNNWRQKEELNKFKTKYGECPEDVASTDDSDSSSEDDEEANLTEVFEKDFYKTLACLKNKDPKIYDDSVNFFSKSPESSETPETSSKSKTKKAKPLTLRDHDRKMILENAGVSEDEDEDEFRRKRGELNSLKYAKEQKRIKDSFKVDEDEDSDEDFLVLNQKSESVKQKTEELDKESQKVDVGTEEKDFWADPGLDKGEKFLRDYIMNKMFMGDEASGSADAGDAGDLEEDEDNVERQEEFEHKFNFRFEEPDANFLKRYPRTMDNSLRKKDTRRAEKRSELKQRKEEQKARKREELKQLKALKRKEIAEKIAQLREITGNDDMQFESMDLEGDFDPAEHDKKMQDLFNEEYYKEGDESVKPEFPDVDEELGVEGTWDNYDGNVEEIEDDERPEGPHCEDDDFNMDADYTSTNSLRKEMIDSTKKKRRRRSKFAEMISKAKPKFDTDLHGSYKSYIDQYYALDYEDMIGDLPCRFKYRSVVPNDYGLSVEEILMADDKELNKWCSLKKALEHKPEEKQLHEVKMYQQKSSNEAHKQRILRSLYTTSEETDEPENPGNPSTSTGPKKNRRKRKTEATKAIGEKSPIKKPKEEILEETQIKHETNGESEPNEKIIPQKKIEKKSSTENAEKIKEETTNGEETIDKVKNTGKNKSKISDPTKRKMQKKSKTGNSAEIKEGREETREVNTESKKTTKRKKNVPKNQNQEADKSLKKLDSKSKQALRKEKYKKLQKKNRSKTGNSKDSLMTNLSDERLRAYGINPKNFKNKLKYGKQK